MSVRDKVPPMKCVTYLCTASGTVKQPVSLLQGVVPRAKGHMGYLQLCLEKYQLRTFIREGEKQYELKYYSFSCSFACPCTLLWKAFLLRGCLLSILFGRITEESSLHVLGPLHRAVWQEGEPAAVFAARVLLETAQSQQDMKESPTKKAHCIECGS